MHSRDLGLLTIQDRSINCQEAIPQGLIILSLFESFLFRYDLVDIVARKKSDLVTTMSVIYAKETHPLIGTRRLLAFFGLKIQNCRMRIFHGYTPTLHGRKTKKQAIIFAQERFLAR